MKKMLLISSALAMLGVVQVAEASVSTYNIKETFKEPDTDPRDTIFIGSFDFDNVTKTVTNLKGILSESMTGHQIAYPNDDMTWLTLNYQLSSIAVDTNGDSINDGLLVTTFLNNSTDTFSTMGGGNGWEPGSGYALYSGFPGANPGNAYARIFVNMTNPLAPLTQAQIDKLAYADCAPGGMMMATCMTGTTVAGYGAIGSMSGYPVSQEITLAPVPEPETYAMLMAGLGLIGFVARKRRKNG